MKILPLLVGILRIKNTTQEFLYPLAVTAPSPQASVKIQVCLRRVHNDGQRFPLVFSGAFHQIRGALGLNFPVGAPLLVSVSASKKRNKPSDPILETEIPEDRP